MTATDVERFSVYHSPQTTGYTCWVGCWLMPDGRILCVAHRGSDDPYDGSSDQEIQALRFGLEVEG